jgi:hypothetical protein
LSVASATLETAAGQNANGVCIVMSGTGDGHNTAILLTNAAGCGETLPTVGAGGHSVWADWGTNNCVAPGDTVTIQFKSVEGGGAVAVVYWSLEDGSVYVQAAPGDTDGDGCADSEEAAGAPAPKPGSTGAYNPFAWYDFYDVPVPVRPDSQPNGTRNKAINFQDVLGVLAYVGTYDGDGGVPNRNGVSYDSLKDGNWNGDTVVDAQDKVGRRYDRSPSPPPNPPNDAGPPSGAVNFQDVLVVLAQIGLACTGVP